MKKIIFFMSLFLCSLNIVDATNKIHSIDMKVYIDKFGTANIEEVWIVDGSSGTEWYKAFGNLGNSKLSDYTVSMDGMPLKYKMWNINQTLSQKKGYYGITNGKNGQELCFGKYDYDKHVFVLNYTLSNFIFNVSDGQVIYFNFIDKLSDVDFDDFSIEISTYYELPNTIDVWGYGYKGYAYVSDGKIKMSNEKDMDDKYVVLLAKFPSNTFDTTNSYSKYNNFNDVYKIAEKGTFFSNETLLTILKTIGFVFIFFVLLFSRFLIHYIFSKPKLLLICLFVLSLVFKKYILTLIACVIFFIIYLNNRPYPYEGGKKIKKKNTPYYREIPCDGDIFYANTLIKLNKFGYNKSNIVGAIFLKWIKEGLLTVDKNEKNDIMFILKKDYVIENTNESMFYDMVYEASKNGILEKKELKKWAKKYHSRYLNLFDRIELIGEHDLSKQGHIYVKNKNKFMSRYVMDDKLYEESKKLYGLKLFLNDFSSIKDRNALDVNLWQEYLMFAYLFGNAKKVMKQFKNLYPEIQVEMENSNININTIKLISDVSYQSVSIANRVKNIQAAREASSYSSGGGGSSRSGGGSGSFGGGGGGSR